MVRRTEILIGHKRDRGIGELIGDAQGSAAELDGMLRIDHPQVVDGQICDDVSL
jgi:hypothetical protein